MMHLTFAVATDVVADPVDLKAVCLQQLSDLKGPKPNENYSQICASAQTACESQEGAPIYFFDFPSSEKGAKRILALSLIHGDEEESGSVSRAWIARLQKIHPRNAWRVIPIANPDGLKHHTRMNARGVDLNRNFPTDDWKKTALAFWKQKMRSDPRRYPGPTAASEKETLCLMKQLEEFKPDFIISVHTPLGVLDFDGPKVSSPDFKPLPWTPLGNYPGSLGRLMWRDHKVPVLTIELKGASAAQKLEQFDRLQDISGTIAIQAHRIMAVQDSDSK
jgi:hypothetical protein